MGSTQGEGIRNLAKAAGKNYNTGTKAGQVKLPKGGIPTGAQAASSANPRGRTAGSGPVKNAGPKAGTKVKKGREFV